MILIVLLLVNLDIKWWGKDTSEENTEMRTGYRRPKKPVRWNPFARGESSTGRLERLLWRSVDKKKEKKKED